MFNKIMCFIASSLMIGLTIVIKIISCVVAYDKLDLVWALPLVIIIFPILSYCFYLNSNLNKWVAFLLAFLTSVICFGICIFPNNLNKGFIAWYNDLGTGIMIGSFILAQLVIVLICAIIHLVIWWRSRR